MITCAARRSWELHAFSPCKEPGWADSCWAGASSQPCFPALLCVQCIWSAAQHYLPPPIPGGCFWGLYPFISVPEQLRWSHGTEGSTFCWSPPEAALGLEQGRRESCGGTFGTWAPGGAAEGTGFFTLEKRRPSGFPFWFSFLVSHLSGFLAPDRRGQPGGGRALLPKNERRDERKWPQVAPREVQVSY